MNNQKGSEWILRLIKPLLLVLTITACEGTENTVSHSTTSVSQQVPCSEVVSSDTLSNNDTDGSASMDICWEIVIYRGRNMFKQFK